VAFPQPLRAIMHAALAGFGTTMNSALIHSVLCTIVFAGLLWGAITDLKERIIPNELTIVIALSGLVLCIAGRQNQIGLSLFAVAAVFLGAAFLCRYGMIGGGDVKLLAAVTLLVPPHEVGMLLMNIALAGGILSCIYLGASFVVGGAPLESASTGAGAGGVLSRWFKLESARIASRKQVPYAIAILGGVVWSFAG
jgi:prepilin peptidase CpaA